MRFKNLGLLGILSLFSCQAGSAGDTLKIENIAGGGDVVVVINSRSLEGWHLVVSQ